MTETLYSVGYLVGSISRNSINRDLAVALRTIAPEAGLELREIPIGTLPFYNRDLEAGNGVLPESVVEFRESIGRVDGILLVTPEYNRSIPGVLKNALDWASRPNGAAAMTGKPSYVVGTSPGAVGTAVAQQHLRSILSFLASPELAQPEVYLQYKPGLFDANNDITVPATRDFLLGALNVFHGHIQRYATVATDLSLSR
jgi:chromate reductase